MIEDKKDYKFIALGVMIIVVMLFIGVCDIGLIIVVALTAIGITLIILEILLSLLLCAVIWLLLEGAMFTVIDDKKISIKNYRMILSTDIKNVLRVEKVQNNARAPFRLQLKEPMEHYNRITKKTKKSKQMHIVLFPSPHLEEILEKFFPDKKVPWINVEP